MHPHSLSLSEIAHLTGATLKGDPTYPITGVADLHTAGPSDIAFFADPRYEEAARSTQAGALFMRPDSPLAHTAQPHILFTDNPKAAFAHLCAHVLATKQPPTKQQGAIHPTAVIAPSAKIAPDAVIGPHVVIEEEVIIGSLSTIGASCYIGHRVHIGQECHLFPHVTLLERSVLGNRVILQSGVVIGSLGFGYKTAADGTHTFIPHLGFVTLEDDVEIGANSTVDRAQLGNTVIAQGTKIDNQVQIGHNVHVGKRNLIVAQVGIAGSSSTGDNVILAGKVGINDHVAIGDNVTISAFSAVSKSLPQEGVYGGIPAETFSRYKRNLVHFRNLPTYLERLNHLEEHLEEYLEKHLEK